jgi:hypothetical protein
MAGRAPGEDYFGKAVIEGKKWDLSVKESTELKVSHAISSQNELGEC